MELVFCSENSHMLRKVKKFSEKKCQVLRGGLEFRETLKPRTRVWLEFLKNERQDFCLFYVTNTPSNVTKLGVIAPNA